jgi:hypothetical protein
MTDEDEKRLEELNKIKQEDAAALQKRTKQRKEIERIAAEALRANKAEREKNDIIFKELNKRK